MAATTISTNCDAETHQHILFSELVHVQNKRYYFDVKEHEHGRFLKLAETSTTGRKSRMVIPMYMLKKVDKILSDALEVYENLEAESPLDTTVRNLPILPQMARRGSLTLTPQMNVVNQASGDFSKAGGDCAIKNQKVPFVAAHQSTSTTSMSKSKAAKEHWNDTIENGKRKYYFNLKENNRGRYLRVKAIGDIPKTVPGVRRNLRSNEAVRAFVLPAVGIIKFRDVIRNLEAQFGVDISTDKVALVDREFEENGKESDKLIQHVKLVSKSFKKVIFVDIGENNRGTFARLTEQQRMRRESITIPSSDFLKVSEWLREAYNRLSEEERNSHVSEESNVEGVEKSENLQH